VSPLPIAVIAFACIFSGTLVGMFLRKVLPDHHLSDESKKVIELSMVIIATLAALVIGLLLASARAKFDSVNNGIVQVSGKIVLLDRVMAEYGPETKEARDLLRSTVVGALERLWPKKGTGQEEVKAPDIRAALEELQRKLRRLAPKSEDQRLLKSRAVQLSGDIAEERWLIAAHRGQSSLPIPFFALLVFWLVFIFFSAGLLSPPNPTVFIVLFVCALSATGALYLLQEMDRPFEGLIGISSVPLRNALELLGR
jgi:hypothetical protein